MRNVSDKSCRENQNTHFVFKNCFSFENRAVYGIMWENIVEQDSPLMTIWRMHVAYWTPKATNIHSVCVILIAFRMQQWLHERASTLRYTYIGCLVKYMYYLNILLEEVDPLTEIQTQTSDTRGRNCNHNTAILVWRWQIEREGKKSVLQGATSCRLGTYRRFRRTTLFLKASISAGLGAWGSVVVKALRY